MSMVIPNYARNDSGKGMMKYIANRSIMYAISYFVYILSEI